MKTLKDFLDKYQIDYTESLDQKNFGSVYRGVEKDTQKEFAIKSTETHPNFDNGLYEERYEKAKLLTHSNLLVYKCFSRFEEKMVYNMAIMPLLEMRSLDNYLDLTIEEKKLIVHQILDAIYYLHEQNIVWQNLSEKHILLEKNLGNLIPKIINYGNSRKIALPFFADYEYLAPEQFDEHLLPDLRSDIWAFGVLIYKLWTGRLPFGEKSASLPNSKIKERILGDWEPGLYDQIAEPYQKIVKKCIRRKKEDRWNNCGEIIAVIKNWQDSRVNITDEPLSERPETKRKFLRKPNNPVNWAKVLLLFFLAALLGYFINQL